jgi:lipopolysaccharide cholinephosphotransferase
LIIADEIDRLCKKHNIRYSIIDGTLLGAVRHKGFIPWDDDMDVGIIRDDYEKFIAICENELDEKFGILNRKTDVDFPFNYTKITLKGTHIVESFARDNAAQSQIFVDVFPVDKIPKDKNTRIKLAKKVSILKRILWMKKGYGKCIRNESAKQRLKYDVCKVLFSFIPYNKAVQVYSKFINDYKDLPNEDCYLGIYEFPETFNQECDSNTFDNLIQMDFEDRSYPAFAEYDKYLKTKYNDYMTLPPEKDRVNHGILEVDFGEY